MRRLSPILTFFKSNTHHSMNPTSIIINSPFNINNISRYISSAAVIRNITPAKSPAKIGIPVSRDEIAKALQVPVEILDKSYRPAEVIFTAVDLARPRFAPLINSLNSNEDVTKIAAEVRVLKGKDNKATSQAVTGAKDKFKSTSWKSIKELITFYEEVMLPARVRYEEFKVYELNNFHIKDDLKRGLSAFKQDYLDKQKVELVKVQKQMQECQEFIKNIGQTCLDTDICNDIANILRICGESNPFAHRMSMKVLEDMNLIGISFNELTVKILHAVTFNDGPLDDSALMFTLMEYPERGEINVSNKPIEEIAEKTLNIISNRHHTPLDEGKLLHQTDTHPCLQRSIE